MRPATTPRGATALYPSPVEDAGISVTETHVETDSTTVSIGGASAGMTRTQARVLEARARGYEGDPCPEVSQHDAGPATAPA